MSNDDRWSTDSARRARKRFLSPALATFQAFDEPMLIRRGSMQYLWDGDERRYLDAIAQNVTISVGHSHPAVNEAVQAQMDELVHCTTMWMHPSAAEFAEELIQTLPGTHDWVAHFVNSGAEAIDLAMLLTRVHTGNTTLIALRNSYHGTHFGTATLSGLDSCHQPVLPAPGILHVSAPDEYRGIHGADPTPYLAEFDATISSSTDGTVGGFFFEPVLGFGGVTPLTADYVDGAAERIRAAGGLVVSDEVQTGFGRTGKNFWGFQEFETVPDVIVAAKGIGNGFPLAAVICRRDVAESMTTKKFFNTYGSSPTAMAAGRAVLMEIAESGLQENSRVVGARITELISPLREQFTFIGDVRGPGLLIGVDVVADPESRKPDAVRATRIQELLRDEGVIAGLGGSHDNVIRIVPPMCVSATDADFLVGSLRAACEAA